MLLCYSCGCELFHYCYFYSISTLPFSAVDKMIGYCDQKVKVQGHRYAKISFWDFVFIISLVHFFWIFTNQHHET